MKKLLIILLSVLSLTAFAQEKKTVAVLDPICRDNSVNLFYQQVVRGAMESAVTNSNEYEAYDRSAFDQIQKEQSFQRTGAVNDSQIKKMGEMAGVDYVLVSEVSAYEGYLSAVIKILNVTTGKYDKSKDDVVLLTPEVVKNKCREMATSLFGYELPKSAPISHPMQNKTDEETVFLVVEQMPQFPGGQQALFDYLRENVKYPAEAAKEGAQGKVTCEFVVSKNGSIVDVNVLHSSGNSFLDAEAVRVIYAMPKWKPGYQKGKPVRVRYTMPVTFKIN